MEYTRLEITLVATASPIRCQSKTVYTPPDEIKKQTIGAYEPTSDPEEGGPRFAPNS